MQTRTQALNIVLVSRGVQFQKHSIIDTLLPVLKCLKLSMNNNFIFWQPIYKDNLFSVMSSFILLAIIVIEYVSRMLNIKA